MPGFSPPRPASHARGLQTRPTRDSPCSTPPPPMDDCLPHARLFSISPPRMTLLQHYGNQGRPRVARAEKKSSSPATNASAAPAPAPLVVAAARVRVLGNREQASESGGDGTRHPGEEAQHGGIASRRHAEARIGPIAASLHPGGAAQAQVAQRDGTQRCGRPGRGVSVSRRPGGRSPPPLHAFPPCPLFLSDLIELGGGFVFPCGRQDDDTEDIRWEAHGGSEHGAGPGKVRLPRHGAHLLRRPLLSRR